MRTTLAVAGHTNTGKTTLIRTLLRKPVGEVDDRQNVTQFAKAQEFSEFYARLVDTPGLQNAGAYLVYLSFAEKHPDAADEVRSKVNIEWDIAAATAIEDSDVCIYVASLEHVPSEPFLNELTLVKSLCDSVVVLLNKDREFSEKDSRQEAERRKGLWHSACEDQGVTTVIDFDAHWASPRQARRLLERVSELLPPAKQEPFRRGIQDFSSNQERMKHAAIEYALSCIVKCRKKDVTGELKRASGEGDKAYLERLKERLSKVFENELKSFLTEAAGLYDLVADVPMVDVDGLDDFEVTSGEQAKHYVKVAATAVSFAGALTSITTPLLASFAIPAMATVGLGLIVGGLAVSRSLPDRLRALQAGHVAIICVGTLWILSCYGWGRGDRVPDHIFHAINERSRQVMSGMESINWHTADSDTMKNWIIRFLDRVSELQQNQ